MLLHYRAGAGQCRKSDTSPGAHAAGASFDALELGGALCCSTASSKSKTGFLGKIWIA
jgi:hypothetical protein